MPRTKSSLWNIWVQTPFSTHSGWQFKQHFLDIPAALSTVTELLPLPALGVLGKTLRKRSPRKSSGLETNTLIFGFPQKGFFSARGLRRKLEPECEILGWTTNFSIGLTCRSLASELLGKPRGGGEGLKRNRSWLIARIRVFWFFWMEARTYVHIPNV